MENFLPSNLPTLSARKLHKILLKSYRIGNRVRLKFIRALLALSESGLYRKLGCPTIEGYAEKYFGYKRSQTYEFLRVARKIQELPRSTTDFHEGKLSWSALEMLSRVASEKTEEEWIAFAKDRSLEELEAEVRDAVARERKIPRKDSYGLPNLTVTVSFKLTFEEHDLLRKALEKAAGEMGESLGKEGALRPESVILYMAEKWLSTDPQGMTEGRVERDESIYTVLYHLCPGCRAAHAMTRKGPVEVPLEHVERIEGDAKKVEIQPREEVPGNGGAAGEDEEPGIDRPNPRGLVRKVRLRDGGMCANPYCRRRNCELQSHHVKFRMDGGRTEVWNEVLTCTTCHSLLHRSLLVVTPNPDGTLSWSRAADGIVLDPEPEQAELDSVPVVVISRTLENGNTEARAAKEVPDSRLEDLALALQKLGYRKQDALERVRRAFEKLSRAGAAFTENDLLREALRAA